MPKKHHKRSAVHVGVVVQNAIVVVGVTVAKKMPKNTKVSIVTKTMSIPPYTRVVARLPWWRRTQMNSTLVVALGFW